MESRRMLLKHHIIAAKEPITQVLQAESAPNTQYAISGTKVVATMGPACHDAETLKRMLLAGAVGARVDLTWGPLDFHRRSLHNLQVAMRETKRLCCTLVDTLGRELMIRRPVKIDEKGWPVHEESISVVAGARVVLTTREDIECTVTPTETILPITYDRFTDMAEKGDTIYIGRYLVCGADSASLYLEVEEVAGPNVVCVAKNDAHLDGLLTVFHTERSSDTLLNVQNQLPLLSAYDKECIEVLAKDYELDFISLSYTRDGEDVRECRRWLDSVGLTTTKILAKLETRQSLLNFGDILAEADGIVISRGNLGLDVQPEKMALVQKSLIQGSSVVGKPILVTRVVDTMTDSPRPTRAEATDVANAVLDGADGILLGAETLRGHYPVESVAMIARISRSAERVFDHRGLFESLMEMAVETEDRTGRAARSLFHQSHAAHHHRSGERGGSGSSSDEEEEEVEVEEEDDAAAVADVDERATPPLWGHKLKVAAANGGKHGYVGFGTLAQQQEEAEEAAKRRSTDKTAAHFKAASMPKSKTYMGGTLADAPVHAAGQATTELAQAVAHGRSGPVRSPFLSKLESIASSAVRAADKVAASLILVYTHTGSTAQLVAKYRPPMPIMTLVVPHLTSDGLHWVLRGRGYARQCQITRGLLPVLATPSSHGEQILEEAVALASRMGLVRPHSHVVVVQRINDDCCLKVLTVDAAGTGIRKLGAADGIDVPLPAGGGAVVDFPASDPGARFTLSRPSMYPGALFSPAEVQPTPVQDYHALSCSPTEADTIVCGGMKLHPKH